MKVRDSQQSQEHAVRVALEKVSQSRKEHRDIIKSEMDARIKEKVP